MYLFHQLKRIARECLDGGYLRCADSGGLGGIEADMHSRAGRIVRVDINWVVCDSDWEAEFCRAAEGHPRVRGYVKNQGLGFEVPYLLGATPKKYLPDFIVRVDDGHGDDNLLNLVVEIKGYRGEDAKDKANTMDAYWVPGVNNLGTFGRWAFAEFTNIYAIPAGFDALIQRFVAGKTG